MRCGFADKLMVKVTMLSVGVGLQIYKLVVKVTMLSVGGVGLQIN